MKLSAAIRLSCAAALAVVVVAVPAATATTAAEQPEGFYRALGRDLGLSPQQAEARFAAQDKAADLEPRLRRQLGTSFGGAYFDEATNRLVVGVTDAAAAPAVRAAGARPVVVRYAQRYLDGVTAALDQRKPAAGVTGWYVDVPRNRVVVEVNPARGDGATSGYLAAARALSDAVHVGEVAATPRALHHIRGGDKWSALLWECSVGFNARGSGGSKHFVTAGHCTRGIGPAYGRKGNEVGTLGGSTFGLAGDYGKVNVTSGRLTPYVNRYGQTLLPVKGAKSAPVGATVCRSGFASGWRCGLIKAKNETVAYALDGTIVGGLTRTSACAISGDSGGSFMAGYQAQGMTSGGSGDCKSKGHQTYFQPVKEALSAYGLRLVVYTG